MKLSFLILTAVACSLSLKTVGASGLELEWQKKGFNLLSEGQWSAASIYTGDFNKTKKIDINFIILKDTGWDIANVFEQVQGAAQIYQQCELAFAKLNYFVVESRNQRLDYQALENEGEESLLALRQATPESISGLRVYFIRSFSDNAGNPGLSRAKWINGREIIAELENSVFLTNLANSDEYKKERLASPYNLLAHEMLHILTRKIGHYNLQPKNLLNIWQNRSNLILPQHCVEVNQSPLLKDN